MSWIDLLKAVPSLGSNMSEGISKYSSPDIGRKSEGVSSHESGGNSILRMML
jgi:hypothetical protein